MVTQPSLVQHFKGFIEKNRRDNHEHLTGWHERIQQIYVSCYQPEFRISDNAKQWQKHADKK